MASTKAHILPPVVAPERNIVEFTVKALVLGAVLSMVLAAANAYIAPIVNLIAVSQLGTDVTGRGDELINIGAVA